MRALDERQLRVGNALGDQARMRFLNHVVSSCYDERGLVQLRKLGRVDMRFVDHQTKQFEQVFVIRRDSLLVLLINFTTRLLGQPFGEQVAAIEDEAFYARGVSQREQYGHIRAIGEPQDVGRCNVELVHEGAQIISELIECERSCAARRFAMPTCVNGNHAIAVLEEGYLAFEIRGVLAVAVEQNQRLSTSMFRIVQFDVVHGITFDVRIRLSASL